MTYREEQLILNRINELEKKQIEQDKILNKICLTLNISELGDFPVSMVEE